MNGVNHPINEDLSDHFDSMKREEQREERNQKVNLLSYGFKQAGKNMVDLSGLRNALYRIYNDYLGELTGKQNRQVVGIHPKNKS